MSYEFYKITHIIGILMVFTGLMGIVALRMVGTELPPRPRRLFMIFHGLGLLVALVAGFGLAARLNYMAALPTWVWVKIGVWIVLGAGLTVAKRKGALGAPVVISFLALGGFAAWLAITKPF